MAELRLAEVTAVHPKTHSVDVVLLDNGAPLHNVLVGSDAATTDTGRVDQPTPTAVAPANRPRMTGKRDQLCVVAIFSGMALVIQMLRPIASSLLFDRKDFRIDRHASGVYETVNENADIERFHPSGTFIRIAETTAHEDLTGQDVYGKFANNDANAGRAVHLHAEVWNRGAQQATLDVDPSGNVSVTGKGDLTANMQGKVSVTTGGDLDATVGGAVNGEATAWNLTGPVNITGPLDVSDGISFGTGTNGGSMTGTGSIKVSGEVTGNGIALSTHKHSGVTPGSGDSGDPI